jgi:hypothetical protein
VDVNVVVPLLLAVFAAIAAVVRRLWTLVLPLVVVPLFYAGLKSGWWGSGVGDGWEFAAALVTIAGFIGAVLGLLLGRLVTRTVRRSRARGLRKGGGELR